MDKVRVVGEPNWRDLPPAAKLRLLERLEAMEEQTVPWDAIWQATSGGPIPDGWEHLFSDERRIVDPVEEELKRRGWLPTDA